MRLTGNTWHTWNASGSSPDTFEAEAVGDSIELRRGADRLTRIAAPRAAGDWVQSEPIQVDGRSFVLAASVESAGRVACFLFADGVSIASGRSIDEVRADPTNRRARSADPVAYTIYTLHMGPIAGLLIIVKGLGGLSRLNWDLAIPASAQLLLFAIWAVVATRIATNVVRRITPASSHLRWRLAGVVAADFSLLFAWLMLLTVVLIRPRVLGQ